MEEASSLKKVYRDLVNYGRWVLKLDPNFDFAALSFRICAVEDETGRELMSINLSSLQDEIENSQKGPIHEDGVEGPIHTAITKGMQALSRRMDKIESKHDLLRDAGNKRALVMGDLQQKVSDFELRLDGLETTVDPAVRCYTEESVMLDHDFVERHDREEREEKFNEFFNLIWFGLSQISVDMNRMDVSLHEKVGKNALQRIREMFNQYEDML